MTRFLIYGKTGWIANKLATLLLEQKKEYKFGESRLENRESLAKEISDYQPTHILNAAGVTGSPNIDWCEEHKKETVRSNVVGLLNLCDVTHDKGIHVTYFGTGCIYSYDDQHPLGSGQGFREDEPPNFMGSWYSLTKGMVETMVRNSYPDHVLILRLRMPISDDLHPRSFIT